MIPIFSFVVSHYVLNILKFLIFFFILVTPSLFTIIGGKQYSLKRLKFLVFLSFVYYHIIFIFLVFTIVYIKYGFYNWDFIIINNFLLNAIIEESYQKLEYYCLLFLISCFSSFLVVLLELLIKRNYLSFFEKEIFFNSCLSYLIYFIYFSAAFSFLLFFILIGFQS